jgi:hypothetical protein
MGAASSREKRGAVAQWRTLPILVGGAKSHYIEVEGVNLKYFIFYMVKIYKY